VKGANPDSRLLRTQESLHPKAHFLGGLVREGDGQNAPWRDVAVENQVGDTVGQGPRLAASGSGKEQQGPSFVKYGFSLLRVKLLIQVHARGCRVTRR
jgi:hypothetical protein